MKFSVPDMSCGHCTAAIEKSIKAVDAGAEVNCDLTARSVAVSSGLSAEEIGAAIRQAGYDVTPADAG